MEAPLDTSTSTARVFTSNSFASMPAISRISSVVPVATGAPGIAAAPRSAIITFDPREASFRAMAKPMPVFFPDPVIRAVLFFRSSSMVHLLQNYKK